MFDKGIEPENLTDYHLARVLNKIAEAGPKKDAASCRLQSVTEVLYSRKYRFVVVRSPKLDGHKAKGLEKRLKKEEDQLKKSNQKDTQTELCM